MRMMCGERICAIGICNALFLSPALSISGTISGAHLRPFHLPITFPRYALLPRWFVADDGHSFFIGLPPPLPFACPSFPPYPAAGIWPCKMHYNDKTKGEDGNVKEERPSRCIGIASPDSGQRTEDWLMEWKRTMKKKRGGKRRNFREN